MGSSSGQPEKTIIRSGFPSNPDTMGPDSLTSRSTGFYHGCPMPQARRPRMDGRRIKFLLIGLGIVATMGFMLIVATQKSDGGFAYYVTVKEYTEKGQPKGRFRVN